MFDENSFSQEAFSSESWYMSLIRQLGIYLDSIITKIVALKSEVW